MGFPSNGILVPLKHGVDSFSELCATLFVCTTATQPDMSDVHRSSKSTCLSDLGKSQILGHVIGVGDDLLGTGSKQIPAMTDLPQCSEVLEWHCLKDCPPFVGRSYTKNN